VVEAATEVAVAVELAAEVAPAEVDMAASEEEAAAGDNPHLTSLIQTIQQRA